MVNGPAAVKMGQSLSSNNPPPRLTSQGTLRQSLKRVYSEELNDGKNATSKSLPASPSVRKQLVGGEQILPSPVKVPGLTLESMLKNFEEFTQHQWPTWAKRRGLIAEFTPEAAAAASSLSSSAIGCDDGSGRVVQVDKDKWVFQRHRKTCMPSIISRLDVAVEEEAEKTPDVLQIEENRTPNGVVGGQRSRRSSGYASASNSPSAGKRAIDPPAIPAEIKTSNSAASEHQWEDSNLYEVTLRWMFESDVIDEQVDPLLLSKIELEQKVDLELLNAEPVESTSAIRIYLHLFGRQKNKLPSFIDFLPIPLSEGAEQTRAASETVSPERQMYALVFQDGNAAPQASFPRDISCVDLVRRIVESNPLLLDSEAAKLAIYEKSWCPGKTSRARLRRLNDFDCPLLLAQQWELSGSFANEVGPFPKCAKTLVLQETQNGDIPWEDFTVAELSSFLKVLEREEANHEMQIRERYQLLHERLQHAMQLMKPS